MNAKLMEIKYSLCSSIFYFVWQGVGVMVSNGMKLQPELLFLEKKLQPELTDCIINLLFTVLMAHRWLQVLTL